MRQRDLAWLAPLCLCLLAPPGVNGQAAPLAQVRPGVVFVANGAGDDTSVSENLCGIFTERGLPLTVHTVRWCRWSLPVKDHKDYEGQLVAASRLAREIAGCRASHPGEKIYLVGYSTGTHVVLAAANLLPPHTVDRMVLLAATVSYCYDLRPALRCSRGGIDLIFSKEDHLVVLVAEQCGTADRKSVRTAGESGFAAPHPTHPDAGLYKNLRQFCWHPSVAWTGHTGGHGGFARRGFLEEFVVPMLLER